LKINENLNILELIKFLITKCKMAKRTYIITKAAIRRAFKTVGGKDVRISELAVEEFRKEVENLVERIAKTAIQMAQHAKRKTIKKEDVKLAFEG
jgi:histone H3/H4